MVQHMKHNLSRRKFIAAAGLLTPALLARSTAAAAGENKVDNDKGLVFLFQGDSITDGNRGRNTDPNHIMGHGYAFAVASRVGADFPAAGHTFYNRGISGNSVPDLQKRWQADTLDLKPDVLSILVGINDTAAAVENKPDQQAINDFENGYRQLLQEVRTAKPATIFVLGLPFVYPVGKRKDNWERWQEETRQRAQKLTLLAEEFEAVLVDYPAVFDKALHKAPADYWIWDGIHPTVPAHELMAREWIKQVGRRLKFLTYYR
jgi:lysophospholipase L1-like esterase